MKAILDLLQTLLNHRHGEFFRVALAALMTWLATTVFMPWGIEFTLVQQGIAVWVVQFSINYWVQHRGATFVEFVQALVGAKKDGWGGEETKAAVVRAVAVDEK